MFLLVLLLKEKQKKLPLMSLFAKIGIVLISGPQTTGSGVNFEVFKSVYCEPNFNQLQFEFTGGVVAWDHVKIMSIQNRRKQKNHVTNERKVCGIIVTKGVSIITSGVSTSY